MKKFSILVLTSLLGSQVFSAPVVTCQVFEVRALFDSEQCQVNCSETVGPLHVTSGTLNTPGVINLQFSNHENTLQYSVGIQSNSNAAWFQANFVLKGSTEQQSITIATEGPWNASEGLYLVASTINKSEPKAFAAGDLLQAELLCRI